MKIKLINRTKNTSIGAAAIFLLFMVVSVSAQTFQVKDGAWPWNDRVNRWKLTNVPKALISDKQLPQQSCSSRGLVFPEGLKDAVIGIQARDARRLIDALKLPLRKTDLHVTIASANGKTKLKYAVYIYPNPPKKLNGKGKINSGMLLLGLSADGIKSTPCEKSTPPETLKAPPKSLAERSKFHLYLLVGQSNMAGRGKVEAVDLSINPRVLFLNKQGHWAVAIDPIHTDKPIAGVGLGTTFGKVMAEKNPNVVIGLIPCAVGGTSISQWQKGAAPVGHWGKLYNNAIQRAKIAQHDGVLKGILWHQGEADSGPAKIAAYQKKLTALVADFRKDLNAPDVPFVAGMVGVWDPKKHANRKAFNENLANLPKWFNKAAVVSSDGLKHKGDKTHFSSAALRVFGQRYAKGLEEANSR